MKRPWLAAISHHDPVVPSMPLVSQDAKVAVDGPLEMPFKAIPLYHVAA